MRCSLLSIAVLKRDEQSLRDILGKDPASLSEVNFFGQNALHFATEWPDGLEIILNNEAMTGDILDQLDKADNSPLHYAAVQDNMESVQMLVNADACFAFESLNDAGPKCRRLLISLLYERRRRLMELAIEHKGFMEGDHTDHLASFHTDTASRMNLLSLKEIGVHVPESLRSSVLSQGSLYHQSYRNGVSHGTLWNIRSMREEIWQDLIAAGFLQVDEVWDQVTPIMTLHSGKRTISFAEILLENGADATKELPLERSRNQDHDNGKRHRAIHKLAFQVGRSEQMADKRDHRYPEMISNLSETFCVQRAIFQSANKDPCSCYCSPGGCTALVCLIKGIRDSLLGRPARPYLLRPLAGALLQFDLGNRDREAVAMEFIRMMTFDSLELTHTCCTFGNPGISSPGFEMPRRRIEDQEEIDRIHDEELEGLQQLGTLMAEFTTEFAKSEIPLGEFFEGYWRERMEQVLHKSEPTEGLENQEEPYVWMREDDDPDHEFFAQLWKDEIHWPCDKCEGTRSVR